MLSGWNTGAAMANETIDLSPGDLAELLLHDGEALTGVVYDLDLRLRAERYCFRVPTLFPSLCCLF